MRVLVNRAKALHPAGMIEAVNHALTRREIKERGYRDSFKFRKGAAVVSPVKLDDAQKVLDLLDMDMTYESFKNYGGKTDLVKRVLVTPRDPSATLGVPPQDDERTRSEERLITPTPQQAEVLTKLRLTYDPETGRLRYAKDFMPLKLKSRFLLVRHGETNLMAKQGHRFQGEVDEPVNQLSPRGKEQAEELVIKLDKILATELEALRNKETELQYRSKQFIARPIKRSKGPILISSTLGRAVETIIPFIKRVRAQTGIDLPLHHRASLREIPFGAWENNGFCSLRISSTNASEAPGVK